MMHEFLTEKSRRIDRAMPDESRGTTGAKGNGRGTGSWDHAVPRSNHQTLKAEESAQPGESQRLSGPASGVDAVLSEMGIGAKEHGRELLHHGFTIEQVVHDYGDLCQSVTDLAARS